MPFPLIAAGKLAAADLAGEWLLSGVRADVCCQVVAAAEVPHADATLEGFLTCVDADVTCQLIRAGKAPVAGLHGACVGPFMWGGLARPGGVLSHAAGFN